MKDIDSDHAHDAGLAEAVRRVKAALDMARKDAEYMNGYNSGGWVSGRREGLEIAIDAIESTLRPGQWCEPKPFNSEESPPPDPPALPQEPAEWVPGKWLRRGETP